MKPVVFRPAAVEDFAQAIKFYERERAGLGDRFARAVEALSLSISDRPNSGSPRYGHLISNLRARRVETFPYIIFYIEHDLVIDVIRVLHSKRDVPNMLSDD
jgi:toxin ParE1/3/4